MNNYQHILQKIDRYKSRLYRRRLLIGILSFFIFNTCLFLALSFLELKLWFSSSIRGLLLVILVISVLVTFWHFILDPLLKILKIRKGKKDEEAAREISVHFPEIQDKLINFLQLKSQSDSSDQQLITAALDKKASDFERFSFASAVNFSLVKRYAIGFLVVCLSFALLSFVSPELIKESPKRIVNYQETFLKEAPFVLNIQNEKLTAFRGEDFTLSVEVTGQAIPEDLLLIVSDKLSYPLTRNADGIFQYTFQMLQSDKTMQIEAAGFKSMQYQLKVLDRPELLAMNISVINPSYTGAGKQSYSNTGDITVLEGSRVIWEINGTSTNESTIVFVDDTAAMSRQSENTFYFEKRIVTSSEYELKLKNEQASNKSLLKYKIDVIKDQYPDIVSEFIPDSSTYQFLTVLGSISDDYGFTDLSLNYKTANERNFRSIPIEINRSANSQSFFANWSLDSVNLKPGETLEVFLQVRDNDEVNGFKKTKSKSFLFEVPAKDEIKELLAQKSEGVQQDLDDSKEEVKDISDRLSELEDKLKTDPKFEWQEKKLLEDVIKDKEEVNKQLEELQKKYKELQQSASKFNKQSPSQMENSKKFEELMDQLMDEETKKLYEKLKELLRENASGDQINEQIQKLQNNERNLERDLERASELFKRLQMEAQLENTLQELDSLSQQQQSAADEKNLEKSQQQQKEIQKEFDEFRENMNKVLDMNQDLKRPEALEDFEYEERQIAKELREIMEELDEQSNSSEENQSNENEQGDSEKSNSQENQKQKSKSAGQKQQGASQKMKSLSQKLSKMQGNMQMEMMQANLDQLRDILDNLLKLSFNQEDLMKEMREVNQSDPRFLTLSQEQLKLKDDSQVIQDSLLALASRVIQISSFVTEEIENINENINETVSFLKDRNRSRALSSQQFVMTSINNLALLLDDTMQQMQMSMAEASGSSKGDQQQKNSIPDLQELQDQLGQKIEDLKGSGKSGRELSEELARLAAEQELIRRQLEMIQQAEEGRPGNQGGDDLKRAIQMMEQNEVDLVNKRLTQQLMYRQKQIETRLLQAEKSQREQETEEEREAEKPSLINREIPPEFEEYLKLKKKEIELLKTIPVELNPFYKKEVNDYFRRISRDQVE